MLEAHFLENIVHAREGSRLPKRDAGHYPCNDANLRLVDVAWAVEARASEAKHPGRCRDRHEREVF